MDAASREWVERLGGTGRDHDRAVADLHALLRRAAHAEADRRTGVHGLAGRELDDVAEQAADDAAVSVLGALPHFRGDSRFTTWAYGFVVREVASKVGRHVWRRDGVRYDADAWDELPERLGAVHGSPQDVAEGRVLVEAVRHAVEHELTEHQRRVFVAVVLHGTPLDAVTADLGTNRNAVYKTVFDARRRIRVHLEACDLLPRRHSPGVRGEVTR